MDGVAVTNTSPIIALVRIGQLSILSAFFQRILVPVEVWRELVDKPEAREPAELLALPGFSLYPTPMLPLAATHLDPGEGAAIALAVSQPGVRVLLDDFDARQVARSLGLDMVGTLGILAEAKRRGLIAAARPLVEQLIADGFRVSPELFAQFCRGIGEDRA